MDRQDDKKHQKEYLKDFERAKEFYERASSFIEIDIMISANRTYLAYENISHAILKYKNSQVSKKHAQIWEKMKRLFLKGELSFDPAPYLIKSYKFHLLVDYGREYLLDEKIEFNKEN